MSQPSTELYHLTIREAAGLIESKQLSPVELTQAFLDRIEAIDGEIKSYVTLLGDEALAQARAAEAEISAGNYRGPLHGIPMAHKDLYDTKGVRTTGQSKLLEHRVPTVDSTAISRLADAGSILLGKVAMFELAMGGPETSLFEQTLHPWNAEYATGGSSSGSATSVASGMAMGSLGSDTGGSIRGPAASCGIVGHKPTYGLVSRYGVLDLSWSLDHCGPMTWTVEDSALMLQAIAGYDPKDPASARVAVPDYSEALREDVKGLVIGVPEHYCFGEESGTDEEVTALVKKALEDLESLGAHIEPVTIPCLEYSPVVNIVIIMSEAYSIHLPNVRTQPQNFGENFIKHLYMGGLFSASDYVQAQRVRSQIRREFHEVMKRCDLLAMPMGHRVPGKLEDFEPGTSLFGPSFMAPFNQTGQPAISVPCGMSKEGLPVGMQLAGRVFDDATVFRAAYTYQQHAGHYKNRPIP